MHFLEQAKAKTGVFFYIKEMSCINEESKQLKVVDAIPSRYVRFSKLCNRHKKKYNEVTTSVLTSFLN